MSWLRKILLSLAVVTGLILFAYVISHFQKKAVLEAYKRQLKAQGEKLTIAELIPPLPTNAPNAAGALLTIADQFTGTNIRPWFYLDSNYFSLAITVSPGHARVDWQREILPTEKSTNAWPGLIKEFQDRKEILSQARIELASPVLFYQPNYQLGLGLPVPHLTLLRNLAHGLSYAAILELHQDHPEEAWENLKSCVNLARLDGESEPLISSQTTRLSINKLAFEATWEALQYPNWTENQLTELQTSWNSFQLLDELEPTLAMDRAFYQQFLEIVKNSFVSFQRTTEQNIAGGVPVVFTRYVGWKWQWSYDEELCGLQFMQAALETVRAAKTNNAFVKPLQELGNTYARIYTSDPKRRSRFIWFPIEASFYGRYLYASFLYGVIDQEMERRLLVTAISLKRYQLHNGKYPDQLSALVPDFLAEMPIDIMDGKPLRYRPTPDGNFLLYSVGEDGVDNGGDPNPIDRKSSRAWWSARDAVWPMPATPEEIKLYQDKLIAERKSKEAEMQTDKFRKRYGRYLSPSNLKTN
jgi:hypothetical protein